MEEFLINFPNVSPFHGLQLFWNCCTVGPFHGVRCFKKRLLQPGSPMGSQVLAHLLQSGLIFPWSSRSCQEQCGFPMGHSLLEGTSSCSDVGSSMGCKGTACLTMGYTTGCWGISLPVPGAFLPPTTDFDVFRVVHIPTPACRAVVKDFFLPFLNLFPRGAASGYLWAWPWPAGNLCWRQLAQALSDMGVL